MSEKSRHRQEPRSGGVLTRLLWKFLNSIGYIRTHAGRIIRCRTCVRSLESADCGAASLKTIIRQYRLPIEQHRVREVLSINPQQGTSLRSLHGAALKLGFSGSFGRVKPTVLHQIPLPAIAHLGEQFSGHFVVIQRIEANHVYISDPLSGYRKLLLTEFNSIWSGFVLLLSPLKNIKPSRRIRWNGIKNILAVTQHHYLFLVLCIILEVVAITLGYASTLFFKMVADNVLPNDDATLLNVLVALVLGILTIRLIDEVFRVHLLSWLREVTCTSLVNKHILHLVSLPLKFFWERRPGDYYSRLTDIVNIRNAGTTSLIFLSLDTLVFIVTFGLIAMQSQAIIVAPLLGFLAMFLAVSLLARRMIAINRDVKDKLAKNLTIFFEALNAIHIVKSFQCEKRTQSSIVDSYSQATHATAQYERINGFISIITSTFMSLSTYLLIWAGAHMVLRQEVSIGDLFFLYAVMGMLAGSVARLLPSITGFIDAGVSFERLREVEELPKEIIDSTSEALLHSTDEVILSLESVGFSYIPNRPVISGLDLEVRRGEFLFIAGKTGSGKSTIASILGGLYYPQEGQVLFHNQLVREDQVSALRRDVSMVFQEASLIGGTICENICLDAEIPISEVIAAATDSDLHEFVAHLPGQYDYMLGPRGSGLSSGQQQRVAIARALVRPHSVLILDEATSNLDPETESRILERIRASSPDRAIIVISHRLSRALLADRIVVVEGHRIIESGTHQELLDLAGRYSQLWAKAGL